MSNIMAAWVVKSCRLLGGTQCFGGTGCLHLHGSNIFEMMGLSYEVTRCHNPENYYVKSCRRDAPQNLHYILLGLFYLEDGGDMFLRNAVA
jgi:hypothetical protein